MLDTLKQHVFAANLDLVKYGLVIHTWGNVSGRDPETGYIVIKPSGVSYETMQAKDMVVIDREGEIIEGKYKPSTDAPTHLVLYNSYPEIGGIVHTHSTFAASWAQAGRAIPPFGTTHADHYYGEVPCTRKLKDSEIKENYEKNTGLVIAETIDTVNSLTVPSVLVHSHGPFCWGENPEKAVYNAVALEEIAKMAFNTVMLGRTQPLERSLLDKHFNRKHGRNSYYGQK